MKVKTNVRAGRGVNSNSNSKDNPLGTGSSSSPTPVYVPPVSRCVDRLHAEGHLRLMIDDDELAVLRREELKVVGHDDLSWLRVMQGRRSG